MIFNLPDLPDGTPCRISSDPLNWRLEKFTPNGTDKETGEPVKRWVPFNYFSGTTDNAIKHAAKAYFDLCLRMTEGEGRADAERACMSLSIAISERLPSIGIEIRNL